MGGRTDKRTDIPMSGLLGCLNVKLHALTVGKCEQYYCFPATASVDEKNISTIIL